MSGYKIIIGVIAALFLAGCVTTKSCDDRVATLVEQNADSERDRKVKTKWIVRHNYMHRQEEKQALQDDGR